MTLDKEDIEAHWPAMVRVARSVLSSRQEAQDCAAEAVLQVLERQPGDIKNLEAFMVTVAKRRALDRLRVLHRSRRRDQLLAGEAGLSAEDAATAVVDRHAAAWLAAQARKRLSPQSLRILEATSLGHDLHSIAAREGLTFRAAESDLFRTRKLMRSVWTRALAVLAGIGAVIKRAALPAAPVLASLATLLVILPNMAASPSSVAARHTEYTRPQPAADTSATAAPTPAPTRPVQAQAPRPLRSRSPLRASPQPTVVARLKTPVTSTTVKKGRHGSGADAGLVGGALSCVQNLSGQLHHLGC